MENISKAAMKSLNDSDKVEERSIPQEHEMQNMACESREDEPCLTTHEEKFIKALNDYGKGNASVDAKEVDGLIEAGENDRLLDSTGLVTGNNEPLDKLPPFSRSREVEKPLYSRVTERIRLQKHLYLKSLVTEGGIPPAEISSSGAQAAIPDDSAHGDLSAQDPSRIAPVDEIVSAPADEIVSAPADEIVSAPADEIVSAPADEIVSAPADGIVSAPADGIANAPADGIANALSLIAWENIFLWTICIILMVILLIVIHMWVECSETNSSCTQFIVSATALFLVISVFLIYYGPTICKTRCYRR